MSAYDIVTNAASDIGDAQADLNGEITALDKNLIDAVCAFFEYGTNSDLSDATRTSGDKDVGVFVEGGATYTITITGLSASTTYYHKAKCRMIRYDDESSLDYAAGQVGFLHDASAETALWNGIFSYSTISNKVFTDAQAIVAALISADILTTLWSAVDPSTYFWSAGTQGTSASFASGNVSMGLANNEQGGKGLVFSTGGYDASAGNIYVTEYDIDLTDVASIDINIKETWDSTIHAAMTIDGSKVWSTGSQYDELPWTVKSIDVNGYTGVHTVGLGVEENGYYGDSCGIYFGRVVLS